MNIMDKFKPISPAPISLVCGLIFWLLIAVLPVFAGKVIVEFYANQMKKILVDNAMQSLSEILLILIKIQTLNILFREGWKILSRIFQN